MEILYEDSAIVVVIKPAQELSECSVGGQGVADRLAAQNRGYLGIIHRLDYGVGGVTVFAKTPAAAAKLSADLQAHRIKKEYLAIVHGSPTPSEGELRDLLFHDRTKNKSFVVERERRGVKEAILSFSTLDSIEDTAYGALSLLHIVLKTGRTHQIRVQFSARRHPLLGDGKYGAPDHCDIGLCCYKLTFEHPLTNKQMSFSYLPSQAPWTKLRLPDSSQTTTPLH